MSRINYIEHINSFWEYIQDKDIRAIDITVYFALLDYNNTWMWKEYFSCDWSIILEMAKVSKNAYYSSLERLELLKLITYEKGVRNVNKPKISIRILKNRTGTAKRTEREQNEEQNSEQKRNLYKTLNIETIKLLNNNIELVNSNLGKWIEQEKSIEAPEQEKQSQKGLSKKEMDANFKKNMLEFGFREDLIVEWMSIRKEKKAINSQKAFDDFVSEVKKCNSDINHVLDFLIKKQWRGFESEWYLNSNKNIQPKSVVPKGFEHLSPEALKLIIG